MLSMIDKMFLSDNGSQFSVWDFRKFDLDFRVSIVSNLDNRNFLNYSKEGSYIIGSFDTVKLDSTVSEDSMDFICKNKSKLFHNLMIDLINESSYLFLKSGLETEYVDIFPYITSFREVRVSKRSMTLYINYVEGKILKQLKLISLEEGNKLVTRPFLFILPQNKVELLGKYPNVIIDLGKEIILFDKVYNVYKYTGEDLEVIPMYDRPFILPNSLINYMVYNLECYKYLYNFSLLMLPSMKPSTIEKADIQSSTNGSGVFLDSKNKPPNLKMLKETLTQMNTFTNRNLSSPVENAIFSLYNKIEGSGKEFSSYHSEFSKNLALWSVWLHSIRTYLMFFGNSIKPGTITTVEGCIAGHSSIIRRSGGHI